MHTPAELSRRLARQWQNPDLREARLTDHGQWPIRLSIGRPPAKVVSTEWDSVVTHVKRWREVHTGQVIRESSTYRSTGEAFDIPVTWEIPDAEAWAKATGDRSIAAEHSTLKELIAITDPLFHSLFIRHRSLWQDRPIQEILQAADLVTKLEPGCAGGTPLRAISLCGIDSKFFERHRGLIVRLLDLRFDGEASRQGLETFLGAWRESDHWLLVVDLDGTLLPFSQQRIRSSELANAYLNIQKVLIVENERCCHLLPKPMLGFVAILGAGNNLTWLRAPWLQKAEVIYWGDIDTWGLSLLAQARSQLPNLKPLLMDRATFDTHSSSSAVSETVIANPLPPENLLPGERDLYQYLVDSEKGRIEQEFIRAEDVSKSLMLLLQVEHTN